MYLSFSFLHLTSHFILSVLSLSDREAVQALDAKLKDERKSAGEKGLYFGGLFLFHNQKYDKAREYIDRALKLNAEAKDVRDFHSSNADNNPSSFFHSFNSHSLYGL